MRVDSSIESGRRALDDYAKVNYGTPLEELEKIQAVMTGTAAEVTEGLRRYVAAGARHLVIRLAPSASARSAISSSRSPPSIPALS